MQVQVSAGGYQDIDAQALAIAVFKDEKPDDGVLKDLDNRTGGIVKSVISSEELKGKEGETAYLHLGAESLKFGRLLLVGVGERADYKAAQISQMAGTAARVLRSKAIKSIALMPRGEFDPERIASATVE